MNQAEYKKIADKKSPKSKMGKNCTFAFLIGGSICAFGQLLMNLYLNMGLSRDLASSATSVTLIFAGVLLTGLNIYPKIAKYAGAGTIVPITGFANSVASPAIESKTEGYIMGVGAKLFTIAGPVIVYGICASLIAGVWYFIKSVL